MFSGFFSLSCSHFVMYFSDFLNHFVFQNLYLAFIHFLIKLIKAVCLYVCMYYLKGSSDAHFPQVDMIL